MYALTPSGRKRAQLLVQLNNQQRKTRQVDANKRQTNNSRNEKLLNIEQDLAKIKRQKLQQSVFNTTNGNKNDLIVNDGEEKGTEIECSEIVDKENSGCGTSNIDSDDGDITPDSNENSREQIEKQLFLPEKTFSGKESNVGILGEGHISILHAYVRDDLFKNIKILSPSHLETRGEIMKECLKLLKYSEVRNGNLTYFANACRAEIRKTMCSRRGYVKRQTGLLLGEMMDNDSAFPMFDVVLMNFFYNPDYETDEKVVNAWYIYVLKFLPLVNKKWREATAPDKLKNGASMFHFITISDEALMRWFIAIWVPILVTKKENELKKNELKKNDNEDKEDKPIKRGPHDTNVKATIYTHLHHSITNARRNYNAAVRWNQIFWDEVKKRHSNFLTENGSLSSKTDKDLNHATDLPLPDLNENQEFLASYGIGLNDIDKVAENDTDDDSSLEIKNATLC